jgi:hypothetical protein
MKSTDQQGYTSDMHKSIQLKECRQDSFDTPYQMGRVMPEENSDGNTLTLEDINLLLKLMSRRDENLFKPSEENQDNSVTFFTNNF